MRTRWALNAHVHLDSSHVARSASASWRWCHRACADGPGATATVDVAADVVTHDEDTHDSFLLCAAICGSCGWASSLAMVVM